MISKILPYSSPYRIIYMKSVIIKLVHNKSELNTCISLNYGPIYQTLSLICIIHLLTRNAVMSDSKWVEYHYCNLLKWQKCSFVKLSYVKLSEDIFNKIQFWFIPCYRFSAVTTLIGGLYSQIKKGGIKHAEKVILFNNCWIYLQLN